jgi:aminotransferase
MVREIADLAIRHDLLVLSDEIYGELTYDSGHCSILSMPEMKERTILLHGMSKAWAMTGFRIGYACGPREIIEAMNRLHQYTMLCAPTLSQVASIEAFKGASRDIPELRDIFRKNRNYMFSMLKEIGLPCSPLNGAFYAFPSVLELGLTSTEFAMNLLQEEKVAVVPGTAFGQCGEGHVRCSYATGLSEIKIAMERIGNFVDRIRKLES